MARNSLYLILNSVIQATLGFAFWIIMARLFSTADVGRASSLISAMTLISYIALLGLSSTFIRYLPTASNRDALITAGLFVVGIGGAAIALLYVLATPVLAPRLAFVEHSPALTIGFVLLTAAAAVNLVTDSIFIASRKAGYNALADGAVGGITRLFFGVALAGTGAYGLFCASAGGFAAAALASIVLIITVLHGRPSLRKPLQTLKPILRFSGANYVGDILNLLPNLVVPLIVLDRLGASTAAYYFVAFQMVVVLYAAGFAVTSTFLAEGSHAEEDWRKLLRRGRRVMIMFCLPGCLMLVVAAHWVLLAFGARYSQHAAPTLMLLAVAAIPVAANNWWHTVLRLLGRLGAMVLSNVVYAIAICGLAWFLAPHGLFALTAAWPIGSLLGGVMGAVPVWQELRRRPRHKRRRLRRRSDRSEVFRLATATVASDEARCAHREPPYLGETHSGIAIQKVGDPAIQGPVQLHRDPLRRESRPAPAGHFPYPGTDVSHRLARGSAGWEGDAPRAFHEWPPVLHHSPEPPRRRTMPVSNVWLAQCQAEHAAIIGVLAATQAAPGRAMQGAGCGAAAPPCSPLPPKPSPTRKPNPPITPSPGWSGAASPSTSRPSSAKSASPTHSSTETPAFAPGSSTYAPRAAPSRPGPPIRHRKHTGPYPDQPDHPPQETASR